MKHTQPNPFRDCCVPAALALLAAWLLLAPAFGATPAGYSEYYVPGDEDDLMYFHNQIRPDTWTQVHSVITVVAWAANTTVYYDHWEDGYDFNPLDPDTADETVVLATRGSSHTFETAAIDIPRSSAVTAYDGRDYIYIAGGAASVNRITWPTAAGTVEAIGMEVYPVRPQLTTYIIPFGENLVGTMPDFERVFALIQATADGTVVQFDLDGNGTLGDTFYNIRTSANATSLSLDRGDCYILDRRSLIAPLTTLNNGTMIKGTETLQVHYLFCDQGTNYESRGVSAFPTGLWDNEYYAPVDSDTGFGAPTDVYLYNPNSAAITIDYESTAGAGSFSIAANTTVSFYVATGTYVPENSSLYVSSASDFWGISSVDRNGQAYDWSYSLIPAAFLVDEYFIGWAPGCYPVGAAAGADDPDDNSRSDSGLFITAAQDNVRVFVDRNSDGTADYTYDLDRLQTQYVWDTVDGDLSGANVWATGPISLTYGQNPDTAYTGNPAIDTGDAVIPGVDFVDLVLTVEKTADPVAMPTTAGSQTTFSIVVNSEKYTVDDISVTDLLPAGWAYVDDSTAITLADLTTISGNAADPSQRRFMDQFNSQVYNNNADNYPTSLSWSTSWDEESDGTPDSPTGGDAQIITDGGSTSLRIQDNDVAIARIANLSGYSGAILRFDYRRNNLNGATDYVRVRVCTDAAQTGGVIDGTWEDVTDIGGIANDTSYQTYTVDLATILANPNSSTFALQFTTNGVGSGLGLNEYIYFDNVQILLPELTWPTSLLGDMAPQQQITITFDAETVRTFTAGDITRNFVTAVGTRTVGDPPVPQTFTTTDFAFNNFVSYTIQKTSNAPEPLYPGDQFTYTVAIANPSASAITGLAVYDPMPTGVSYVADSGYLRRQSGNLSAGDTFATAVYNRNDGYNIFWAGGWTETNDAGSATGGEILITSGQLRFNDYSAPTGPSIRRSVNLTAATAASLSFNVTTSGNLEAGDQIAVQISPDGSTFTTLETFSDDITASRNYDITSYIGTNTTVRFVITAGYNGGAFPGNEYFYVDNLYVYANRIYTDDPPNLLNVDRTISINAGDTLQLVFDVTVGNPLGTGISSITNEACATADTFFMPLCAEVTDIVVNPTPEAAEVGDRVWLDLDGDGVQDVGEGGLANVEVTLKDRFGTPVAVTTTDANGYFLFTGIAPGDDYYIEVTDGLPAGLTQSYPSGHSDSRTDPFDLTAGQVYHDADLGFAPNLTGATFGDLVWSDYDGDGFRDPSEPGLSGLTVQLSSDVDGDGRFEPGGDDGSASGTTTTAADGTYLFTGVTASGTQDYWIYVNPSQAGLSGYTTTTGVIGQALNVNAGDVLMTFDFGFRNASATYTITDRVWYDANTDGQDDGETGLAGVTIALLDASSNVIATAITDASGYYSFSGLPGSGADYRLQVTDTAGILTNFYGPTAAALAGSKQVANLSGNLDYTSEPTEPNFGYNTTKSIGDFIYNDANGNGSPDSGETGIGGVLVRLYNDVNGNGLLDGPDTLVTSTTSASNGSYLFTGLADGNYIVDLPTPPSGYTYTTESPDNDPATGHQQAATLSGGSSVLNRDFGYQPTVSRTISGTLWEDQDEDGVIDGTEGRLAGVTIELLSGGTVVSSTTTDGSGNYTFASLTSGTYTVRVVDRTGILNGYETTYEVSGTPFNGEESVDVSGGNQTSINFGYKKPKPTLVLLSAFKAWEEPGRAMVQWMTRSEVGTIGYQVYRQDEATGETVRLNAELLPALIGAPLGGTYRFADASAQPGRAYRYRLAEVTAAGEELLPRSVRLAVTGRAGGAAKAAADREPFARLAHVPDALEELRLEDLRLLREQVQLDKSAQQGSRLKIAVRETGLCFVAGEDIAARLRLSPDKVRQYIAGRQFALTNQGRPVAYLKAPDDSGLYFYGEAIDSLFTEENVYFLATGTGLAMGQASGQNPVPASGVLVFGEQLRFERDQMSLTGMFYDPDADYWMWDYLFAGYPDLWRKEFPFTVPDPAGVSQAQLKLRLHGGTNLPANPDQHVVVELNGQQIGEGRWDGQTDYELTLRFDGNRLADGENTLRLSALKDPGVSYSVFYVDSFELTYARRYRAVDDVLAMRGGIQPVVTAGGFSTPEVWLFDVTDPLRPKVVNGVTVSSKPNQYLISFRPAKATNRYLALSLEQALLPASLSVDAGVGLRSASRTADYLVIAPPELKDGAAELARYRAGQGYKTLVVEPESIYDEFNHGLPSPRAIRDFLAYAHQSWRLKPQYVVLVGKGTYDYRDIQGLGDNLVPPLLVGTAYGLFASDNQLADVSGADGVPDIMIGRLPAVTPAELADLLQKIQTYESDPAGDWLDEVILLADNPDQGGNFPNDSAALAALLPAGYDASEIYLSQMSTDGARQQLLTQLADGTALFNYLGHGGLDRLADEGILRKIDVAAMSGQDHLPIAALMTCVVGRFEIPGYVSLGESLVLQPGAGAAAVWAPTGLSYNYQSALMDRFLFEKLFLCNPCSPTLGEIVRDILAQQAWIDPGGNILDIYTILGDPALRVNR